MGIFKLNKEVSETTEDIDPDDVVNVKTNLKDLGYYQTPDYGMTKFGDTQMFEGLRKMQKEKGLSVDGVAKPQGETEGMFNQLLKNRQPQNGPTVQAATQTPQQTSFQKDMEFRRKNLLNSELKTAMNNNSKPTSKVSNVDKAGYASAAAMQGLSLGWADEIEGVSGGVGYGIGSLNKKWNKTGESFGEAFQRGYTKKRDDRRAHLSEGYQKAPITTGAAEMGAAAINPLNKFISPISKTAPIKVQGKQALKGALRSGVAYGAGAGEGGASEHIKNIGIGAVSGTLGHKASKGSDRMTRALNSILLRRGINETVSNGAMKATESFLKNKKEEKY